MRTQEQNGHAAADIFELLRNDHRNVRMLLDEIEGAEDDRQREGLFAQLVTEVEAHSQAEDDVFYTSIEGLDDLAEIIDNAREEHDQVESLLEELDGLPVSGDDWLEKVREIRMLIEHHVGEEESRIFPLAGNFLDRGEALRLGHEFLRARHMSTEDLSSERLVAAVGDSTVEMVDLVELGEPTDTTDASGDVEQMSKRELYELARQRRIGGRSAMTKAELIDALRSK